jgi:hypothetical protein
MRIAVVATALFFILALPAVAGTIETIDPASVPAGSGEHFLTIRGANLGTLVTFSGDRVKVDVEAQDKATDALFVWVPHEIVNTPGTYNVTVGASNAARFIVTKAAKQPLVLLLPDPIVVHATSTRGAVVDYRVTPYGGDDPSPTVKCDPPSGSLFPMGPTEVHCTAENKFGEIAQGIVSVYVDDNTGPRVKVPDRIRLYADSKEGTIVKFDVSASDDLDGDVIAECSPRSGSLFPIGITRVECVAYDKLLNPGYGYFDVEVAEKDGRLVIVTPQDLRVEATSSRGAVVTYNVTAVGTDDPQPVIKCDPPSDSFFARGVTTVSCTASDRFGNNAKAMFDVVVMDSTAPVLDIRDITAEADGGVATVKWDWIANDTADGKLSVTCNPESGSVFAIGQTVVECSATDYSLNSTTGFFTVNVVDTIPPMITSVKPAMTAQATGGEAKMLEVPIDVEAIDANDPMPLCRVTTITANEAIDAPGRGNANPDWYITGPLTVQLRNERNGDRPRIYTINVTCGDMFGNEAESAMDVTVAGDTTTAPPRRRSVGGH